MQHLGVLTGWVFCVLTALSLFHVLNMSSFQGLYSYTVSEHLCPETETGHDV